jgi:hypothetical protein
MATWEGFQITIPAQPLLRAIDSILETLLIFLEIVKSILEVIKIFLILFGNPIILLLEALMALILDLFHALQQTGIYAYYDLPDLAHDPNFKAIAGGSQAFKNRFNGSLLDQKDAHRPQPDGFLQGGFILMVIDADGPLILIQIIKAIIAFFKNPKKVLEPQYPAPVHLKAVPLNEAGSAIFDIETLLGTQSQDIAIEWQLPGIVPSASAGFTGLTAQVIQNFRVPNWLIEIGLSPPTQLITISPTSPTLMYNNSVMTDPKSTGLLKQNFTTRATDPRNMGGAPLTTVVPVNDDHGDPIVKFSYYAIIDGFAAFFADLGGTVRFVYENIPLDTTFYVRVRAFFGNLSISETLDLPGGPFVTLNWASMLTTNGNDPPFLPWPSTSSTPISMGKPSTMIKARLSKNPTFDVLADLRALFQVAFALDFHIPLPAATPVIGPGGTQEKDSNGNPIYQPQFNSAGQPVAPLTVQNIGWGTLGSLAGAVSTYYPKTGPDGNEPSVPVPNLYFKGSPPYQWPWQDPLVQAQANKLAIKFGNILLEIGSTAISALKQLMQGPLPAGAVPGYSSLEQMILYVTQTTVLETATPPGALATVAQAFAQSGLNTTVTQQTANAYLGIFTSAVARENVLAGINYIKSLGYQGVPPDWISMSILDLIPWSGQILYQLIAMVQALIDAFKGLLQQIIDFINLIERKITALEIFIEYLISIINFLLNLNIGFYLLFVPSLDGDVSAWMQAVNSPLGTPPMSGPNGYTAGICLAYLLPDVSLIANAFGLIF